VPQSHDAKFLLDENVSNNLRKLLITKGYDAITVQELNKRGAKNSELIEIARQKNRVFVTYDKDFTEYKYESEDKLILIDIHPLIDDYVLPNFSKLLNSFSFEELENNIAILNEDEIIFKKK
jgi:predicted nuclease of predicted toxin-antitoxin system